ncbi:hypothetical protein [Pseudopedobacter saltans]|nr:hypothetical protein [Pseudopedobacter saltans]
MKKKKLIFLKISMLAILVSSLLTGCKKNETEVAIGPINVQEDYKNEKRYLSISTSIPIDKVVYDSQNEQFILDGWYKISLNEVQEIYARSNEYKLKYENQ